MNNLLTDAELSMAVGAQAQNSIKQAANVLRVWDTGAGKSSEEIES